MCAIRHLKNKQTNEMNIVLHYQQPICSESNFDVRCCEDLSRSFQCITSPLATNQTLRDGSANEEKKGFFVFFLTARKSTVRFRSSDHHPHVFRPNVTFTTFKSKDGACVKQPRQFEELEADPDAKMPVKLPGCYYET